ncbi:MAG: hypothetical protein HY757_00890 [Nitrospirae bacterium]|nr:hypothetical protein [Nitrospirota bacterium]
MKRNVLFFSFIFLVSSVLFASQALAACAEGKFELLIQTPSGQQKTVCVPEAARQGIENAAEHADTTVIPVECSCWSLQQVKDFAANYDLTCVNDAKGGVTCYKDKALYTIIFSIMPSTDKDNVCVNSLLAEKKIISLEESDACYAIIEPYVKAPYTGCPCWTKEEIAVITTEHPELSCQSTKEGGIVCYINGDITTPVLHTGPYYGGGGPYYCDNSYGKQAIKLVDLTLDNYNSCKASLGF